MKICLINSLWGNYARGGAENIIKLIVTELREQGHEVILITTHPLGSSVVTENNGLKVYYLKSNFYNQDRLPYWARFIWHIINIINIKKYVQVKKILEQEKPDLVWTHNLIGLGFLIFNLFKAKRFRHFHTLHDIQLLHPSGLLMWGREKIISSFVARVYQAILKSYISTSSIIISPSQWLLELHKQQGFFHKNTSLEVGNPVAKEVVVAEEVSENSNVYTFLYVGQIENHKGIGLLLEAFTLLDSKVIRLVVVGEGSLLGNLKKQNIDSRIIFRGREVSEVVKRIMSEADCLVVPSVCYENYPTVILEAQSIGLSVIGSNFGGIQEMLDSEKLFVPTAQAIKLKLEEVLNEKKILNKTVTIPTMSIKEYLKVLEM